MKKTQILTLLLFSIFISSCESSDIQEADALSSGLKSTNKISNGSVSKFSSASRITGLDLSVLPNIQQPIKDGYYIVNNNSLRALSRVGRGEQIVQTDLVTTTGFDDVYPSSVSDVTINYNGTEVIDGVTTNIYKLQWGSFSPYTLHNMFFDVFNNSSSEAAPIITWESTEGTNQKFIFEATGNADNSVYIKSLSTGKYLQIKGNSPSNLENGAVLEQRSLNSLGNNSSQKFLIKRRY